MERDKQTPVVSIISLTYNHAPYIRECLDGFLMQQTDFPFEVIIHDDASTDGTTEIVKEYAEKYPDIIKPIIQTENQYSKHHDFNRIIQTCFEKCQGQYIAFCEGDDYWIDPLKLQKQANFLNHNLDCGMCYAFCLIEIQDKGLTSGVFGLNRCNFDDLLIDGNCIPTPTTMLRTDLYAQYIKNICPERLSWKMGDYPIWLYSARVSKIHCEPVIVGVYRKLDESASHSSNIEKTISFVKGYRDIKLFFNLGNKNCKKYARIINYKYFKTLISLYYRRDAKMKKLIRSEMKVSELTIFQKFVIWCCTLTIIFKFLRFFRRIKQ